MGFYSKKPDRLKNAIKKYRDFFKVKNLISEYLFYSLNRCNQIFVSARH